ncbi:MAG TPA: BTAD domain-containing putative transcriptional regulator [Anaerolineaceae bacterium]
MPLREMVIASQLLPPGKRQGMLHRRRLAKKLARILETPLTLVQAGTGYGKSTGLADLTDLAPDLFWYTISQPERDPLLFLAYLLAAFDQGGHSWGHPFLQQFEDSNGRAVPNALNFLLNTLTTQMNHDAVLVLDDYHIVADVPEVVALIERLVDYRPPRLHIVLSGRQIPASPAMTRWRVKGQVLTIDRNDLAFTVDEIVELFNEQFCIPLTPNQASALAAETEGWVIALQMIGKQMQDSGTSTIEEVLNQLPSAMEGLFEYLAQEVLARQPEEIQQFLEGTSILRQMNASTCNFLMNRSDSGKVLQQLYSNGLFITAMENGVFRYQHLFHDFLLSRLQRNPTKARQMHLLAADFFQNVGNLEENIYHLLHADDFDQAAAAIETIGPSLLQVGRLDSLTGWISRLPGKILAEHPGLHLILGDILRLKAHFDEAIETYQVAGQIYSARGDALGHSRSLRSQAQVYLDTVRPLKANSLLEEALQLLEPQEYPAEVAALLEQLAENSLNLGHPNQAQALHQEARLLKAESDPSDIYLEARALLRTGRLSEAQRLLESHQEASQPEISRPQRFHRETPLLQSLICIMKGEARRAEYYARQGLAIGRRLESPFVEAVALMRIGHSLQLSQPLPWTMSNYRQAAEAYHKAIELVHPFKVTRVQVEPLWGLCRLAGYQDDVASATRYAQTAIEIAEQAGDIWFASLNRIALGASMTMAGQVLPARTYLERARNDLEQAGDSFGWSAATLWMALGAWWQGDAATAMEWLAQLIKIIEQNDTGYLLTHCTYLGLKDDQTALPLLIEAYRRGIAPVYLGELIARLGLTGIDYHPGYSLVVRSLGAFEVWRGTVLITARDWQREKARQLFQFLLTQRGQWLTRDQIVDRLWRHLDAESGIQNFKVALNALNRALEPARPVGASPFFVIRRENAYLINPQARLLLDADHFELAAGSNNPDDLRRALAIYEDDYLAESLGEEWIDSERERIRQVYLGAAERLAEHCYTQASYDEVLSIASKMLERDCTWENAYRLMMRAQAAQGNRAQVYAIYKRCAAVLADELDVTPSPETAALMEKLVGTPAR